MRESKAILIWTIWNWLFSIWSSSFALLDYSPFRNRMTRWHPPSSWCPWEEVFYLLPLIALSSPQLHEFHLYCLPQLHLLLLFSCVTWDHYLVNANVHLLSYLILDPLPRPITIFIPIVTLGDILKAKGRSYRQLIIWYLWGIIVQANRDTKGMLQRELIWEYFWKRSERWAEKYLTIILEVRYISRYPSEIQFQLGFWILLNIYMDSFQEDREKKTRSKIIVNSRRSQL